MKKVAASCIFNGHSQSPGLSPNKATKGCESKITIQKVQRLGHGLNMHWGHHTRRIYTGVTLSQDLVTWTRWTILNCKQLHEENRCTCSNWLPQVFRERCAWVFLPMSPNIGSGDLCWLQCHKSIWCDPYDLMWFRVSLEVKYSYPIRRKLFIQKLETYVFCNILKYEK